MTNDDNNNNSPKDKKPSNNPFSGFEEFIQSHNIHIHRKPGFDKSDEGKIQSFLEHNFLRLTKVSTFLQQKLSMIEKYDQSESLIRKIQSENDALKEQILDRVVSKDSFMNHALKNIFNTHYKKVE